MTSSIERPACLLTGGSGYLGSRVKRALEREGWRVIELTRRPAGGADALAFQLGSDVPSSVLAGAQALVHCAYDFSPIAWPDIRHVNVAGSERLLRAAAEAGVRHLVYISSISAFEGCRSLYGAAKLETEAIVHSLGGLSIRPGLIWGSSPGGMFKRLIDQVDNARVLPLVGGEQHQYLVNDQDLSDAIVRGADGSIVPPGTAITIADETPRTMRRLLLDIAAARGRSVTLVPVPWRPVWAALKAAESCGLRLKFRSDSLIGLVYQDPQPSFALQRQLGVECRPLALERAASGP